MSGLAYVFQWVASSKLFTMQAVLKASQFGPQYGNEYGFGTSVALSGNMFAVGSLGGADVTGQLAQGIGNVYIYVLQAPAPGTSGAMSAFSTAQPVQVIANMPVSNAMAISMAGNYLCVGIQNQATVNIMMTAPVTTANPIPNFDPTKRWQVGSRTTSAGTGMGQIVVATMIDGLLYVYMGQPDKNVGAVFVSTDRGLNTFRELGIQGGLTPGFGTSIVWNTRRGGNYLFAGNFLNNPHALIINVYYEWFGKSAQQQRLVSNDLQTKDSGVFSNFGSMISGNSNSAGSIIAVGASLGPSLMGRLYIYSLMRNLSPPTFSLQGQLAGSPGTNFAAAVATMLSSGEDIAIVVGAPSTTGSTTTAYVDIFIANVGNNGNNLLPSGTGIQRLVAPPCVPLADQFSCGANFGGSVVVDGTRIIVGAHNFGVQPGTGRVYVYVADLSQPRTNQFSLYQILVSPPSEYGFGAGIALGNVQQNVNTPPPTNAQIDTSSPIPGQQLQTINMLYVGAMGNPQNLRGAFPYNQPQGVGSAYVYVNVGLVNGNGQPYSILQSLQNTPIQIMSSVAGTGAPTSIITQGNDLFMGNIWRNEVRYYRYNGVKSYTLLQTLRSPYGGNNAGCFGASLFAVSSNRGLIVGAPNNGTVFMYLNAAPNSMNGQFNLIRVLSAMPTANQFGAAVSSSGDRIVVGAPGASIVSLFPLTEILKLPAAQLTITPTTPPTANPTTRAPTARPGTPTAPLTRPTTLSPTRNPSSAPSRIPTVFPTTRSTTRPTPVPTGYPVFTRYTERELTASFAFSTFGPCDIQFLFEPLQPTAVPTPSPKFIDYDYVEEAAAAAAASSRLQRVQEGESESVLATETAKEQGVPAEAQAGLSHGTAPRSGSHANNANSNNNQGIRRSVIATSTSPTTGTLEIPLEALRVVTETETGAAAAAAATGAANHGRALGGGGGAAPPTPSPVVGFLGYYAQTRFSQLGYVLPGSTTPRTKYYLDIELAGTGWGGNPGQFITFYVAADTQVPGYTAWCDDKNPLVKPRNNQYTPSNACRLMAVPCSGKLSKIFVFSPPAAGVCSQSENDWIPVAQNIEVSEYITRPYGGTLIITYVTTGVDANPATITCPYKNNELNAVFMVAAKYSLKSVNPWPTYQPTYSSQELLLVGSSKATELAPGFSVYVLCVILGTVIWTILGFRLTIVRTNAANEGVTSINGLGCCMYMTTVGTSFLLDLSLAVICVTASDPGIRVYGIGLFFGRFFMFLPSVFVISKVYMAGAYEEQLDETHMENNSMTYAMFSLFVLPETQLLVYYPWKETEFTKASKGYPDFERMRMSHFPKLVSTVICTACSGDLLKYLKAAYVAIGTTKSNDVENFIALTTLALVYSVFMLFGLCIECAAHLQLSKYKEGKEDIMDYEKHNKKSKRKSMAASSAMAESEEDGGGGHEGGGGRGEEDGRPRASTKGSVRNSVRASSPGLPPHMMQNNSGFVPHAPRLSTSSFSGHPGMVYPPGPYPPGGPMGPMGPTGMPMSMPPQGSMGPGGPRIMPAGAIHPPMGSPSAIGARRQSVGGKHFQATNPPPPMNGGRSSVRPLPQPRDVGIHGNL